MKRPLPQGSLAAFNRRWRVPFIEPLESRAVLSVCGVTCSLADGLLSVEGTAADDLIAVRYDASAATVSVVGKNDELIGAYPLADLHGVNINGLGGNDQVQVDSQLRQSLNITGASGEATEFVVQGHQHGTTAPATIAVNPALKNYGPTFGPSLTSTTTSLAFNASATTTPATTSATVATTAIEHASHGSAATDVGFDAHVHDSALVGGIASSLAGIATLQHSQHATYRSITAAASESGMSHGGTSPEAKAEIDSALSGHDVHAASGSAIVPRIKLVPKPCTVSFSGGTLVTSVDGKRQCNCEQKKQAAEEATRQVFGSEGAPVTGLVASLTTCVPCQQSGLSGLPAEFQSCSPPMLAGGIALPISKSTTPVYLVP